MAPRRPPVALLPCLVSCECVVCMTLGLCGAEPRCRSALLSVCAPALLTGPHNYVWRAAGAAAGGQHPNLQISGCQGHEPVQRNAPLVALEPSVGLVLLRRSVGLLPLVCSAR